MYRLFFEPIIGSPGDRLHVLVRALSVNTGALYSKQFLDWTELEVALEPVLVGGLHPKDIQLKSLRNSLSGGKPCELGGIAGAPYCVDEATIEKLGLVLRVVKLANLLSPPARG